VGQCDTEDARIWSKILFDTSFELLSSGAKLKFSKLIYMRLTSLQLINILNVEKLIYPVGLLPKYRYIYIIKKNVHKMFIIKRKDKEIG
jgi:hypothetical protein